MSGISVTSTGADRSHVERRRMILEKYPQVQDLLEKIRSHSKLRSASLSYS